MAARAAVARPYTKIWLICGPVYLPGEVGGGVESNGVSYVAICKVLDVYSLNALRIAIYIL